MRIQWNFGISETGISSGGLGAGCRLRFDGRVFGEVLALNTAQDQGIEQGFYCVNGTRISSGVYPR